MQICFFWLNLKKCAARANLIFLGSFEKKSVLHVQICFFANEKKKCAARVNLFAN